jgi:hypothetical protein
VLGALQSTRARTHSLSSVEVHNYHWADVSEVAVEVYYYHMQPSVLVVCGVLQNCPLAIV